MGLEFATGIMKEDLVDTIVKNYKMKDTDFDKCLVHGIISQKRIQ